MRLIPSKDFHSKVVFQSNQVFHKHKIREIFKPFITCTNDIVYYYSNQSLVYKLLLFCK